MNRLLGFKAGLLLVGLLGGGLALAQILDPAALRTAHDWYQRVETSPTPATAAEQEFWRGRQALGPCSGRSQTEHKSWLADGRVHLRLTYAARYQAGPRCEQVELVSEPWQVTHFERQAPSIGQATMQTDGTIVLLLRAQSGASLGDGRLEYRPDHPQYQKILRHLGGLQPGQSKPCPPF